LNIWLSPTIGAAGNWKDALAPKVWLVNICGGVADLLCRAKFFPWAIALTDVEFCGDEIVHLARFVFAPRIIRICLCIEQRGEHVALRFDAPGFRAMKSEGILGVIHEATYPRFERDARYRERQVAATQVGLLWGAYHYGDATNRWCNKSDPPGRSFPRRRGGVSASAARPEKRRQGVLLLLDFEKNGHYPGGTMTVAQAVAFVERIRERTGKYPGLYCSEYRLQQIRKAERNIFRADNGALQLFWQEHAWFPTG
jgi:hypothetical protein